MLSFFLLTTFLYVVFLVKCMTNRKIAILTPTFQHFSGIDRVVQLQAEEYSSRGDAVTVFTLKGGISPRGYKVFEIGMPKGSLASRLYRLFFFLDGKAMRRHTMLKEYDEVISHFYPMNWFAHVARKKYDFSYVYYNHGVNTSVTDGFVAWVYMQLFDFFNARTLSNVDTVISISEFLANEFYKRFGVKSEVVPNKIDTTRFHAHVNGSRVIERYGLSGKKVFLFVGRIAPHKNVHGLIEAFHGVRKKLPSAVLLVVGKPSFTSYQRRLEKMAGEDVVFTGFVSDEDLASYYGACDCYVTASLWEGFDLPVAEAQACGKPVVCFDAGAHKEVLKNGELVRVGDVAGFSDAMIRAISPST